MNEQDAKEYTESLGQITAGAWRQIALAARLGVPAALGLSTREWVDQRLGGYVRLSIPERREAVAELSAEGRSTREIGDVLGVDHKTVVTDRHVGESSPDEPEPAPQPEVASPAERPAGESSPDEPPEPPRSLEDLAGQVDDDGAIAQARLVRDFQAGCRAFTRDLLPLDTRAVAEALSDEGDRYAAGSLIRQMRGWLDQLDRSLHGLRAIKGGKA